MEPEPFKMASIKPKGKGRSIILSMETIVRQRLRQDLSISQIATSFTKGETQVLKRDPPNWQARGTDNLTGRSPTGGNVSKADLRNRRSITNINTIIDGEGDRCIDQEMGKMDTTNEHPAPILTGVVGDDANGRARLFNDQIGKGSLADLAITNPDANGIAGSAQNTILNHNRFTRLRVNAEALGIGP